LTKQSAERSPARTVLVAVLALFLLAFAVGYEERGTDSGETTGPQHENTQGAAAPDGEQQQEDVFTPVTVSLVGSDSEAAVKGTDGRYHVVYELLLTNAKAVPATLKAVEVLDAVEWLVADGAIEPDPLYQNVVGGPIHRLTTYGLELLAGRT
jgi:hypothetical protein